MAATWSTDTVRGKETFSYWRYVVREAVLNVAPETDSGDFKACISWRKLGKLKFSNFVSSPHILFRKREHLAEAENDNYLISLQREGRSLISQGGDDFSLEPGEIAIVDGQQPFRTTFPEKVSRAIAVIPRRALENRAPWIQRSPIRKISADSSFIGLIQNHLLRLTDFRDDFSEAEAMLLTENLCNLIALASARAIPTDRWKPTLQIEAILAFCRNNLSNPELSIQSVASRFKISVRTVHQRFSEHGTSFGRWIVNNRLDACQQALQDPSRRALTITEIAYSLGFNDLSHFNRLYRARFGETPGASRAATRS